MIPPCESPLLFMFWYLPRFPVPVLNYFDWLKQPSRFTLHRHLLLWHMYYTYIASLGGRFTVACVQSYFYYTPRVDAFFFLSNKTLVAKLTGLVWTRPQTLRSAEPKLNSWSAL